MFTLQQTPHQTHRRTQKYTPYYPSPLSSSPLRSSPPHAQANSSPLQERCANLVTPFSRSNYDWSFGGMDGKASHGLSGGGSEEMILSSPTRASKRVQLQSQRENTPIFSECTFLSPQEPQRPSPPKRPSNFSKRATRSNPLLERSSTSRIEEGRETRRKLFLKKVREEREDKVWERRNGKEGEDELMRVLWDGERRREMERLRIEGLMGVEEEEGDVMDEVLLDEVRRLEEGELDAMLEEREGELPTMRNGEVREGGRESVYGSDDDEYDSIFQDVIEEEMRLSQSQSQQQERHHEFGDQHSQDQDMMDLS